MSGRNQFAGPARLQDGPAAFNRIGIMGKTYVSGISDYLNSIGLLKDMPASVRRMAEFLTAIVEAVMPKCPTIGYNTGVRCRKRGCKGSIHASLQHADGRIANRMLACILCAAIAVLLVAANAMADNGQERARRHSAEMSFLDNGVIRLGVDLNLGGAITYLSRSGAKLNLVNSYDCGRQIQMSYYSGPVPFSIAGKQPKPEWRLIGWNPIQVGDAFGNASRLLEHSNDAKQVYVKCIPLHWPLDNVAGECTYECWFSLQGSAVHARCRLVNHRPDHTQYPARNQEYPALYTNGPWYRLLTYTGDRPFTGGELSRIEKRIGEPGPWSGWTATESWAALVNDDGFGLGIWSPHCCGFNGGFAAKPGKGGPYDNPTGYIAPSPKEIIDWNIDHEYGYDLIVGDLRAIRKYVYDHAARPTPPSYRFEKDRRGWFFVNATDTGRPIQGELNVLLEQDDPQLHGPVGFWQASDASILVIRAASHTHGSDARVFWNNLGDERFSENKSLGFTLTSDGEYRTYRIKLTDSRAWRGPIVQLRFDPVGAGAKDEWIRIKSIAFEK